MIGDSGAINYAPLTDRLIPISITAGNYIEVGSVLVCGPIIVNWQVTGESTRPISLIDLVCSYYDQLNCTQFTI